MHGPGRPEASSGALAGAGLSALAMLAFAANSLLCRLALRADHIDPASFGALRLAAGVLVLAGALRLRRRLLRHPRAVRGDWVAAAQLFAYVVLFSFAYASLPAATGALILFGAVQLTMLGVGLRAGERFAAARWVGLACCWANPSACGWGWRRWRSWAGSGWCWAAARWTRDDGRLLQPKDCN